MPLSQEDIRQYYEKNWKQQSAKAADDTQLAYSDPLCDAVLYPIYEQLIADLALPVEGGRLLDVGCGSGRWLRYFLERFRPRLYMGIDYAQSSIDLLRKWRPAHAQTQLEFRVADVTDPGLDLGEPFDFINVANVLFHIPENDKFMQSLKNLARHLAPAGRIVTTEYMPRVTMRTEWMLVRSRYELEQAVRSVGLQIAAIKAYCFFANDPMGVDGPDAAVRGHFHSIRAGQQQVLQSKMDETSRQFFHNFFVELERTMLAFCHERIADVDMPSQKLVVLRRAS